MIYQPVTLEIAPSDLNRLALEAVNHLMPQAKLISSERGLRHVHLALREFSVLTAFEFYACDLDQDFFEEIFKIASELEAKRKKEGSCLKEIAIYLLAPGFSSDFLARIPFSLVGLHLFEWRLIGSKTGDQNILIQELGAQAVPHGIKISSLTDIPAASNSSYLKDLVQTLSTPELIAFGQLGMELRQRSLENSRLS